MAVLDYYSLLGLPANESTPGIDAAYRDFVRRAEQGPAIARRRGPEFVRAFSILSTPSARLSYDDRRNAGEIAVAPSADEACEPVISIFASRESVHPSFEALFERLARNFTEHGVPKAEHPESITVEIEMQPEEASRQGTVSIGMPTFELCPECDGLRHIALFPCHRCDATGFIERTQALRCALAPEPVIERALDDFGIYNCYLRLHIRVVH